MHRASSRHFVWVALVAGVIFPAVASATVIPTPSVPQPSGSGQIVGANFQNPTSTALPAHVVELGQAFAPGAMPSGSGLSASINGVAAPTQIDIKTRNADGSAKFGVISVIAPSLSANSTNPTMFSLASPSGTPISLSTMPGYTFNVSITFTSGASGTYAFNVPSLLASAIAAGKVSYWRQGPVVTEGRIDVPVTSSMHMVFDISKYSDGSYSTDVQYDNDNAMTATGGTLTYTTIVTQNGTVVYTSPSLVHFQYQQWHKVFSTNGASNVNVQHDITYLEKTGTIMPYALSIVDSSAITDTYSGVTALMAQGDWSAPFGAHNVYPCYSGYNCIDGSMPDTGDRGDIGPTTEANTFWLLTQDATLKKYALYQADTSANIPWHLWDVGHSTWLNTDNYPNLWADPRGGTGTPGDPNSGTLTQQTAQGPLDNCCTAANGWAPENAHQPDLSYIPYLLTGNRYYLDQINAQASWAETNTDPASYARNAGQGLILNGADQVRAQAWNLREINEAAWANPDGSSLKAYFNKMVNNNYSSLISKLPSWTTSQGQVYGTLPGDYGDGNAMAPFMQDYLSTSVGQSIDLLGNASALQFLNWESNWNVGRFTQDPSIFDPRDGFAYNLATIANGVPLTTWSAVEKQTEALGDSYAVPSGWVWPDTQGDYPATAAMNLVELYNRTGSASALKAYNWIINSGASGVNPIDPKWHIVPTGTVVQPPPNQPTVSLSASPNPIPFGQTTTVLFWTSTNATSCTGSGFTASATAGSVTVTPAQSSTVYSITCSGTDGTSAPSSVGVTVTTSSGGGGTVSPDGTTLMAPPATGSLVTADGTWTFSAQIATGGNEILLNGVWANGGAAVELEVANGGKMYAFNNVNTWYLYQNGGWNVTTDPGGGIPPVPTATLSANPTSIAAGQSATLTWQSTSATTCSMGTMALATAGSMSVMPSVTTTYTITCTGMGGSGSASVTVTVSTVTQSSFSVGSRVKVTTPLNVRSKANIKSGKVQCVQPTGALGTIVGGPSSAQGYTWWNINFDTSCDGWSVQDGLTTNLASTPTAPLSQSPLGTITHPLAEGWTGPEVSTLQSILSYLGFFHESPTGYFGSQTAAAVKAYQAANNVAAVGIVGPETRGLLQQIKF